jgi:putative flavoprotein involved in K+ transport
MDSSHDVVIIGGSQSGLAMGYHLAKQGTDFVILEAGRRIGDQWRKRYDSLELFTPARFSRLPGKPFPGDQNRYPTKDEMADYLESYAAAFDLPVQLNTHVESLSRDGIRYKITAGDRSFKADQVVVATGAERTPYVPPFAGGLDPSILQIHSSEYRNPTHLPDGDVLVVGVGNSGAEIALELAASRKVFLSGKPPGMLPKPPHPALASIVFFALHRIISRGNPIGRMVISKMASKGTPVEGITERDFTEAGIKRLPRTVEAEQGKPTTADGASLDIDVVIWATGFGLDFQWIDLPIFNSDGKPKHTRGVVEGQPGMYFLGLPFQYAASSALIPGVGRDAKYLAHEIALCSRTSSTDMASPDQFGHRAVVNTAAAASPEEGANKV